jgi:citrate lyase beta subunit
MIGLRAELAESNAEFSNRYPGESSDRQPVHVVYGGAQLFKAETPRKMGELARKALTEYAGSAEEFNAVFGLDARHGIYARVVRKLESEAVEDYRIDFEDGYGNRPDEVEDRDAERAAGELAAASGLPPFCGLRIKSLADETSARALRTLKIFITSLVEKSGQKLPRGFVITLPKLTHADHASIFARALASLETELGLGRGVLRFEAMIETPQLLAGDELSKLVAVSDRRLVAAHFGAYDYTAACDVTASEQALAHPACDYARQRMKVAFAGTGVWLSDGATNIMPIGPHRPAKTPAEFEENRAIVHRAWQRSFADVRRSLSQGFYQGWDLHPAQIVARYAAVYSFFLESLDPAAQRLQLFLDRAAQASLVGNVFDDAASGQGLLNFFLRGRSCGALTEAEIARSGLTPEKLKLRSFLKIAQAK